MVATTSRENPELKNVRINSDWSDFPLFYRVLKGPGLSEGFGGGTLGNPEDSGRQDCGSP